MGHAHICEVRAAGRAVPRWTTTRGSGGRCTLPRALLLETPDRGQAHPDFAPAVMGMTDWEELDNFSKDLASGAGVSRKGRWREL